MRMFVMFLASIVLVGGAGYYYFATQQPAVVQVAEVAPAPVVVAPKTTDVYVPAGTISAGVILKPENLARLSLDVAVVSPEMIVADSEGERLLLGSVTGQGLAKGVPIPRSAVVQPGDRGFLAAVLPQGKRAISIPISETGGVSGLVLPGDRVDIILTYALPGAAIDAERDVQASETVMQNIRVLALDQRVGKDVTDGNGIPDQIATTATLQVSPREAEMVTLATTLGNLSLVLNSVHDGGDAAADAADLVTAEFTRRTGATVMPRRLTLDSDVTSLLQRDRPQAPEPVPGVMVDTTPPPAVDRLQRIQIVRGATSGAIDLAERSDVATGVRVIAADAAAGPIEVDPNE